MVQTVRMYSRKLGSEWQQHLCKINLTHLETSQVKKKKKKNQRTNSLIL